MSEKKKGVESLPEGVRIRLEELKTNLEKSLGDDLVGILVHGSVVRGEYRPGESDVDVIIVLKEATFAQLDGIGNALQLARYAARIEAMILTESEIAGASDAFPLLYDEIKQRHVLLTGRDPFSAVLVHDTHRRLRIEQELREAQIRIRRAVTDAHGAREAIGGAVVRKAKQVRAPLHALLAMKGHRCEPDLATVLAKIGEVYGVDTAPIRAAREAPDAAHAAFVTMLTKTIDDVNAMDTTVTTEK
ncbi:MAG: nucleotidyltransferase domain-containing protein [Deltaproteobacteria bacterium]|nr:nucleotidyltransferase domain-containing protein [Deltaproteobacteria bacterium]